MTNKKTESVKRSLPQKDIGQNFGSICRMPHCLLAFDKCFQNSGFHWLIYWRGLLGQAKHKIDKLFHSLSGSPIRFGFGETMTKNRSRIFCLIFRLTTLHAEIGEGNMAILLVFLLFLKSLSKAVDGLLHLMIVWRWTKLFVQRERASTLNNIIAQNRPNTECCFVL